ncbi:MAG TPA: tetratricopeptide repeat protein, partial [Anaerolineae bacterium]
MLVQTKDQPTRNSLCPCGSGKKYKLCCADNQADDHPLLQAAREYYAQRAFAEAEGKCRELLRRAPAHCGALHLLGLALEQQQKHNEAYEAYRSALALAPGTVNLWSDFAELLQTMGRLDEAADAYRQALHCAPNSPAIMVCLGTVLRTLGDLPAALEYHQRAMQLQPDAVEALMNTGSILHALGRDEEAKVHYQRALSLKPDYGYAHYNLGNLLMAHDQFEEGLACYQRTIELLPDYADAYNNLGVAFKRLKHPEEAAECYRRALKLQPDYAEAHYNLGEVLYTLGDVDAAYLAFQRHVALRPEKTAGELTKMAFIQPVIPQSLEEISVSRQRLVGTLEQIAASGLRLEDPYIEVGTLPFYLAYQGLDNRAIQETIARYFLTVCPALDWTAPHCRTSRPAGKRLRIGLASTCFYNHAVGKLTRGLIEHFSR